MTSNEEQQAPMKPIEMSTAMALNEMNTLVIRIPGVEFEYQFDLDSPTAKNDEITLEHIESGWKHTLKVSSLKEKSADWVELVFPYAPESGTYNLIQDPKDGLEPYYILFEVPYEELMDVVPKAKQAELIPDEEDAEASE